MEKDGQSNEGALKASQTQSRRKSLRKGIFSKNILGARRNPPSQRSPAKSPTIATMAASPVDGDEATPRRFSYENASLNSSSDSGFSPPAAPTLASPIASIAGPYASTTDDDESLSCYRPSASSSGSSSSAVPLQAQGPAISLQRRRSNRSGQHVALAEVQTPVDLSMDDEWDYSETEWWGWVILIVTWAVFVVGMGSCLGVWSWAWDVGETPYAPPELEDDPTLPITGYYPALMVCTAVMAWVWVVVAWVGMKYFRHSKVAADDS
ncbi:hypothetical protein K458DRAFT_408924 [Lentithecium fluviatile CBS 122367]|uniref:Uncharacterized protein n=1 Tax=Lentithecium fluviatile CBS 122367 TaxID=1168545 RepID=A0A6G1IKB6_9PLEO|nr:hypothetical protein K458DRAFT_408924 [Lentithecium fluviatile CBS 122367]